VLHSLRTFALALALTAALLATCGPGSMAAEPAGSAGPVVVFAAASLKSALDDIASEWQRATGRVARISYAGTPALARQIEQGAPADIFISADRDWMDYLSRRALVRDPRPLLGNRLVLVAPAGSGATLQLGPDAPMAAVLGEGRLAVANVDAVPAGRYAKVALGSLGVWKQVAGRLVQTPDVRAALRLVARGEAPLGIVYATDAKAEPKVRVVDVFDETTHPAILYMTAAVAESADPGGDAFLAFLRGASARRIFEREGFTVVASGSP
jgi:molybdate transport system substrate-binding protein